ncbi:MAG: hypothetical protein KDD94_09005 [Calditrichaeota bacterium]|nr:hypothetical protein [Calditrichota bacterium]
MSTLKYVALFLFISICFSQEEAVTRSGVTVLLFEDGTWRKKEADAGLDAQLMRRIADLAQKHQATKDETREAYELAAAGWRYTLPQPKSKQARWGNSDGRTTWWYGYWYNRQTNAYSQKIPKQSQAGLWLGDNQNNKGSYRRGGSPRYPTAIELILTEL